MLSFKTTIPVNARIVEVEFTVLFMLDNVQIVVADEDFEGECTELAVRANIFELVDHGADTRILVFENLRNEVFIWVELFAEVEMRWFS